mmetsp:Transcript_47009/g.52376  ORF Transcript_47009/g.52376 Transcript_47009/m.52376 type:complete len:83 (+) Transcript_47009:127-375(+)
MTVEVATVHRVSFSRPFYSVGYDSTTVSGWMDVVLLLSVIDFIVVVVVVVSNTDVPASLLLFAPVSVWMEIESNRGVVSLFQ